MLDTRGVRRCEPSLLPAGTAPGRFARPLARAEMRSRGTLLGAMLVRRGKADAMLCGTFGRYADHLGYVRDVIGLRTGTQTLPPCRC